MPDLQPALRNLRKPVTADFGCKLSFKSKQEWHVFTASWRGGLRGSTFCFVLYSTNTISPTMRQHYLTKLGSTILLLYCSSPSLGFKLSTVQVFLLFLASQGKQRIAYNVCLIAYRINLSPVCCNSCNCWKILAALNQMILIGLRFLSLNLRGLWAFYCSAMCNAAKPRIG